MKCVNQATSSNKSESQGSNLWNPLRGINTFEKGSYPKRSATQISEIYGRDEQDQHSDQQEEAEHIWG